MSVHYQLQLAQREIADLRARVRLLEEHVQRLVQDQPSPDSNDLRPYLPPIEVGE